MIVMSATESPAVRMELPLINGIIHQQDKYIDYSEARISNMLELIFRQQQLIANIINVLSEDQQRALLSVLELIEVVNLPD